MPFHLLGFGAAALDATAGDVQLNAVADDQFFTVSGRYRLPSRTRVAGAYLGGANLTRGRIVIPRMRVPALPMIPKINTAIAVPNPSNYNSWKDQSLVLETNDELAVQITNSAAGDSAAFLPVFITEPSYDTPNLDLRWYRFTTTPTSGTLSWGARAEITFQDTLESGYYGVYGCIVSGTALMALRFIFNNQFERPGCVANASVNYIPNADFEKGLGLWGQFENSTTPGVQAFATAGGANALSGALLCQRLGGI